MDGEGDKLHRPSSRLSLAAAQAEAIALRLEIERISDEAKAAEAARTLGVNDMRTQALVAFAADLTAVGDAFSQVMARAPRQPEDESLKSLILGLEMTEREFFKIAAKHGLERLSPSSGASFDPHTHQAILGEAREGGRIVTVVANGYRFQGEVLRRAAVILEETDEKELAALRWLQDFEVDASEPLAAAAPRAAGPRYVKIAGPLEAKPYDPVGIATLLAKLRPSVETKSSVAPRRGRRDTSRPVMAKLLPRTRTGSKRALVAAALVVVAMTPAALVLTSRARNQAYDGVFSKPAREAPPTSLPMAYSVNPLPLVKPEAPTLVAPNGRAVSERGSSDRALARRARAANLIDSVLAQTPSLSDAKIAPSAAPELASSKEPTQPPQTSGRPALVIVLAERRQTSSEIGGLIGRQESTGGLSGAVLLDQDSKQRLSATLNVKPLP